MGRCLSDESRSREVRHLFTCSKSSGESKFAIRSSRVVTGSLQHRCFHTQISTASIDANQSASKEVSDDLSHKQRYRSSTSQLGHPKYGSSFRTSDLDQNSSVIARVLAKPMPNKKPPHFCKDFSSLIYVWSVCGYRTHYPLLLCTTHPVPDVTRQTIS